MLQTASGWQRWVGWALIKVSIVDWKCYWWPPQLFPGRTQQLSNMLIVASGSLSASSCCCCCCCSLLLFWSPWCLGLVWWCFLVDLHPVGQSGPVGKFEFHTLWLFIKCFPPRISLVSSLAVDSLLNYSLDHSLCCLLTQIETDWRAGLWRQLCAALQLCHSSLSLPRWVKTQFPEKFGPGEMTSAITSWVTDSQPRVAFSITAASSATYNSKYE